MATTKCMSPNSRASCSHCSRKILKGAMRVRAELYRWRFARCFKRVVFFHEDCYSPERTSWTTNQPNNKQQAQHMFQRACRLSVADQVREYRDSFDFGSLLRCPVTNLRLTATNSHAHHSFPYSFATLVCMFVEKQGLNLQSLSYELGAFADKGMSESFATFHRAHARLLMVHRDANLRVLKQEEYSHFGCCDHCSSATTQLESIVEFDLALCFECYRYRVFVSRHEATRVFFLSAKDIAGLRCHRKTNPISPNFSPMKLYLASDVHQAALKKHGTSGAVMCLNKNERWTARKHPRGTRQQESNKERDHAVSERRRQLLHEFQQAAM
uniref:PARP-type domain-containing protein n=1 Tax=Hemiselmis andersenii TaxID=464988 RepID=A0A7S1GV21_HEMAN|mmetsp:Transcript_17799/g.42967  ORF Transcript_17799/g.42967 Transcript_17799/m.42967 type:complete len:327 (+) Transcript_17799:161-1141(+)